METQKGLSTLAQFFLNSDYVYDFLLLGLHVLVIKYTAKVH